MNTDLPLAEALMASLADAVYFVDAAGEVSFVNPAALAVLGYDDELELLGVRQPRDDPLAPPRRQAVPRRRSARCCARG